jgi:hypothetical protein
MNYIKLLCFFCLTFTLHAHAQLQTAKTHYVVKKLVTVDDEVFSSSNVKEVYVEPVGFIGIEVTSVVLKNERVILQNEIKDVDLIVLPRGFGSVPSIMMPGVDLSIEISRSGSNSGGG